MKFFLLFRPLMTHLQKDRFYSLSATQNHPSENLRNYAHHDFQR